MQGKPDIRLVPSVVSGDPNDRRSIITAASIPAKKIGIRVPEPVSMALRKYPQLVIVRGDWEWYKQCSEGFIAICRSYSPVLQQFSIDECFIDMSLRCTPENAVAVATQLKDQIKNTLGFTVNVGVGSNKLLAKMASDFEKPNKVHTLWSSEVESKMWPLPVRDLLWVGKKTEERLVAYGIKTIGQLAGIGMGSLTRLVGQKFAVQLHENANGRDDSPVETEIAEAKSYSAERTFPKDLVDPKDIDRAMFNVACIVAHRIRRDDFRASVVSMFVKYKDFSVAQKQTSLEQPTDVTAVILNAARKMLTEVWDGVTPIRQVGMGVSLTKTVRAMRTPRCWRMNGRRRLWKKRLRYRLYHLPSVFPDVIPEQVRSLGRCLRMMHWCSAIRTESRRWPQQKRLLRAMRLIASTDTGWRMVPIASRLWKTTRFLSAT